MKSLAICHDLIVRKLFNQQYLLSNIYAQDIYLFLCIP